MFSPNFYPDLKGYIWAFGGIHMLRPVGISAQMHSD